MRQILARNAELHRRTATADGEAHVARAHEAAVRRDGEMVAVVFELLHHDAGLDRQIVLDREALPEFDEFFLRVLESAEPTVQRQVHRLRHHELLARVSGNGAADFARLVDAEDPEATFLGTEQARETGRTEAHDEQVDRATLRRRSRRSDTRRHLLCDERAVLHGGPHEREPGDLAGQEQTRHTDRLEVLVDRGQVTTVGDVAERQRDGRRRAGRRAQTMTDAARAVHDDGLAERHRQHAVLRARTHAGAAPDARREVDLRMLQPRLVAAACLGDRPFGEVAGMMAQLHASPQDRDDDEDESSNRYREEKPVHEVRGEQ